MADNVAITAGAGTNIASDDIGGVQYQRVKVTHGQDGSATDVSSASPMPVTAPAAARTTHSIAVAMQTDAVMNALTTLTPKFFSETVVASDTDEELVASVTAKKLRVLALVVHCGSLATDATFESGGTTRIHKVPAGANGGQVLPFNPVGWFETASGASLTVTTGTGSSTEISGVYVEV
jgi:hypothetical protein